MSNYILSICIPTYNRISSLSRLIENLLGSNDDRFNIVVQDNCSTDGTEKYFLKQSSPRIVFRQNKENKGAAYNYMASLLENEGVYSLFVIDKDHLSISHLSKFIDYLQQRNPDFGFVELNLKEDGKFGVKAYHAGFDSIRTTAYLSKHPTGFFYRSSLLTKELIQSYFDEQGFDFPFPFEIINAHIGSQYQASVVYLPLLYQESTEETVKYKSISYNENNLFFSPEKRIEAFDRYVRDLQSLNINLSAKRKLFKDVFRRALSQVSIGYRSAMTNQIILSHYNLIERNVTVGEMFENLSKVLNRYLVLGGDAGTTVIAYYLVYRQKIAIFLKELKLWKK